MMLFPIDRPYKSMIFLIKDGMTPNYREGNNCYSLKRKLS